MASPLSLTQSSFLLSSLISSPPHRLDARPLLSYRPLVLSSPVEAGSATLSLGSTSITSKVSTQVIKASSTEESQLQQQEEEGENEEDDSAGVWSVSIGTSPSCQPPVVNGGKSSKTGCLELDAALLQLERMLKRHLNQAIPMEQFIILAAPQNASAAASSSSSSSSSNREKLRGATYWSLALDITIDSLAGGNLYDAAWAAAFAAVHRARIPRTREVAYIPPESSRDQATEGSADMEKMGIKSVKGEKKSRKVGQGRAFDFELVDVWDEGRPLSGLEVMGVGLTVGLLPNGTHVLDTSLDEELSLPTSRRVFLVVSPSTSTQIHSIHLLPSLLNLTAGESDSLSEEDALRFPRPPKAQLQQNEILPGVEINGKAAGGQVQGQWEEQGWGLPTFQRIKAGVQVGSKYAVELGKVLRATLDAEEGAAVKERAGEEMDMS
ncbi:hypothetical protein BCV69DRAFT_299964 [Microstroma glucosiphilum]|uniref:Ribosomal RNA-processing protein 42 n=1 Tax=Pseudomicrostroma glucosiphilum TaxID=1684307 RepID=A0A316U5C6_9BASI|nr:hypothetical protein BCV69DRAFT_299964 [Pseudomicrostroma glucosiphilum]PWN19651.1 hypothetical protein BCV69DRAFT_299964 [Pseudomicrostroma glucosiphilum]